MSMDPGDCTACHGSGKEVLFQFPNDCKRCKGTGKEPDPETVYVALHTSKPEGDDQSSNECWYPGYSRMAVYSGTSKIVFPECTRKAGSSRSGMTLVVGWYSFKYESGLYEVFELVTPIHVSGGSVPTIEHAPTKYRKR